MLSFNMNRELSLVFAFWNTLGQACNILYLNSPLDLIVFDVVNGFVSDCNFTWLLGASEKSELCKLFDLSRIQRGLYTAKISEPMKMLKLQSAGVDVSNGIKYGAE